MLIRAVRNEKVSRPLSKGILDGELLRVFVGLEVARQEEMTKQIGTAREMLLEDLSVLWDTW